MSFTKHQLKLPGSPPNGQKYRLCATCKQDKPPEGGVEMSPTRFVCVVCWSKKKGKP